MNWIPFLKKCGFTLSLKEYLHGPRHMTVDDQLAVSLKLHLDKTERQDHNSLMMADKNTDISKNYTTDIQIQSILYFKSEVI